MWAAALCLLGLAAGSPVPPPLAPRDVFLSVKTSGSLHAARLPALLATWLDTQAGPSTHLFTDAAPAPGLAAALAATGAEVVETGCPADHGRSALCCKMQAELSAFLRSPAGEEWFCHLDDDNYLHLEGLLATLARHPTARGQLHYLGKSSIARPLDLLDRRRSPPTPVRFTFGTGGAGVCLSRAAVTKLEAEHGLVSGFQAAGDTIRLPDDVTLGYLMETVLGVALTPVAALHSHLEPLHRLGPLGLSELVTASYGSSEDSVERNVVGLGQDPTTDPTGFLRLHSLLHPETALQMP
jgi:fringe protein